MSKVDGSENNSFPVAQGDGQSCVAGLDLDLLPYEIAESLPAIGGEFGKLAAMCKSHVASHIEKMIKAKQSRS